MRPGSFAEHLSKYAQQKRVSIANQNNFNFFPPYMRNDALTVNARHWRSSPSEDRWSPDKLILLNEDYNFRKIGLWETRGTAMGDRLLKTWLRVTRHLSSHHGPGDPPWRCVQTRVCKVSKLRWSFSAGGGRLRVAHVEFTNSWKWRAGETFPAGWGHWFEFGTVWNFSSKVITKKNF